jgi:hypothetical protein
MFASINEKTLYIFAISNVITIPMVWALYPESNQRTLEEMDLLFAADSPWVWEAEKNFARLKNEHPELLGAARKVNLVHDVETGGIGVGGSPEGSGSDTNIVEEDRKKDID